MMRWVDYVPQLVLFLFHVLASLKSPSPPQPSRQRVVMRLCQPSPCGEQRPANLLGRKSINAGIVDLLLR
jgi:hypothetical protein